MENADKSLRHAFGTFMTGVTVVTTKDSDGNPIGFTANSFTSVSMDPPLLLVCPGNHLASYNVFEKTKHFAVSILAEGQEAVSNTFASDTTDRFAATDWTTDEFNNPVINGACATFSCSVQQRHTAGDHLVLIGKVIEFSHTGKSGLGYGSKGYFSLSKEQQAESSSRQDTTGITGVIVKTDEDVLVVHDNQRLTLPCVEQKGTTGARSALKTWLAQNGLDVSLGPVYSIYDDTANKTRYTYFLGTVSNTDDCLSGEFVKINSLNAALFSDDAQSTMMKRFKTEVNANRFGLYVGDAESGDVHHQTGQEE